MRIDYTNKEIIDNEIYVHDSIFEGFLYKSTEKQLLVEFKNDYLEKTFNIQFYNVLILNCEMCEFWGKSPHILNWETSDDENLIKEMKKKQNDNKELYSGSLVDTEKSYVETMIILSSGDTIKIVCEYIEFQEEKW